MNQCITLTVFTRPTKINVFAVSGEDNNIKLHEEYRNHSDIPKTR